MTTTSGRNSASAARNGNGSRPNTPLDPYVPYLHAQRRLLKLRQLHAVTALRIAEAEVEVQLAAREAGFAPKGRPIGGSNPGSLNARVFAVLPGTLAEICTRVGAESQADRNKVSKALANLKVRGRVMRDVAFDPAVWRALPFAPGDS